MFDIPVWNVKASLTPLHFAVAIASMKEIWRDIVHLKWHGFDFGAAFTRWIIVVLIIGVIVLWGDVQFGIYPVFGAFFIGNASLLARATSVHPNLWWGSIIGSIATALGAVAGNSFPLTETVLCIIAFAYGILSASKHASAWVALQALMLFVVLGSPYPAPLSQALNRGGLYLSGALAQALGVALFSAQKSTDYLPRNITTAGQQPRWDMAHGLRMTGALVIASFLCHFIPFPHCYWLPFTTAIILQPDPRDTLLRGIHRWGGTLVGVTFSSLFEAIAQPDIHTLIILALLCIFGCFLFINVNYTIFSTFVSAYVVFVLGWVGLPASSIILYRIAATLLGGIVAMLSHLPLKKRPPSR